MKTKIIVLTNGSYLYIRSLEDNNRFEVINGRWIGEFLPDNKLLVVKTGTELTYESVEELESELSADYNKIIQDFIESCTTRNK